MLAYPNSLADIFLIGSKCYSIEFSYEGWCQMTRMKSWSYWIQLKIFHWHQWLHNLIWSNKKKLKFESWVYPFSFSSFIISSLNCIPSSKTDWRLGSHGLEKHQTFCSERCFFCEILQYFTWVQIVLQYRLCPVIPLRILLCLLWVASVLHSKYRCICLSSLSLTLKGSFYLSS